MVDGENLKIEQFDSVTFLRSGKIVFQVTTKGVDPCLTLYVNLDTFQKELSSRIPSTDPVPLYRAPWLVPTLITAGCAVAILLSSAK